MILKTVRAGRFFRNHEPRATSHKRLCSHALRATCMVLLLCAALAREAHAQTPNTLALLPFENVSGSVDSLRIVMPLIAQSLHDKGYELVPLQAIESFLERNRIRNTGMLSRAQLNKLRQEFGVDFAMVGSVDLFYESPDNPQWGLSARVVSTSEATVLWAESAGRTGGDYTGMLGLGTITSATDLAGQVVKLLFQSLPPAGSPFVLPQGQKSRMFLFSSSVPHYGGPILDAILNYFSSKGVYRNPALDTAGRLRVGVTVFENASERRGAGRIMTDVLTAALFQYGRFEVIDPGEVNDALIALGRTSYGAIDIAALNEFKKRTGIDAIFRGTIYRYNEGLKREATTSPEIALDVTMLDVESGKVLWFAFGERSGDDSQIVLDFGIIHSMVPLIRKAIAEMMETL